MKRPAQRVGNVPVKLIGGPRDGELLRVEELIPEIRVPLQPEFSIGNFAAVPAREANPDSPLTIVVAIYRRTDDTTTLQLPPPAPKGACRVGYEYGFVGTEDT